MVVRLAKGRGISSEIIKIIIEAVDKSTKVFNDLGNNAERVTRDINKEFSKLTTDLQTHFGGIATMIARVFSIRAIYRFGKGLLEMGGRAVETANLFAVSFGDMTNDMDKFGRKIQEVSGISDILFRDQSARIFNLFSTLGIAQQEAMVMTQDLMSRGLDMSSLFNIDRNRMFDQLRSGLVGMIKPLRPYGVNLEIATVQQYAWANGIAETGEELTQAQKALARYLIIMDSTSKAQGDMERTIDTVANAQRRLSDMWVQFQSVGGQLVVPMLSAVLQLLIPTVTFITKVANSIVNLNRWLKQQVELYPVLGVVVTILSTMAKMIGLVTVGIVIKIAVMMVWSKALSGVALQIGRIIKLLAIKYWAVTLVVGVIIVLVSLLKRWAGDQTKAGNTLATSGMQASDFANALGDIGDGLDSVKKKSRFLTPLDEIVNIPDASGSTLDAGINLEMPDMDGIIGGLNEVTESLLTGDGILGDIKKAFSDSWELVKLIWNEFPKWWQELDKTNPVLSQILDSLTLIFGILGTMWAVTKLAAFLTAITGLSAAIKLLLAGKIAGTGLIALAGALQGIAMLGAITVSLVLIGFAAKKVWDVVDALKELNKINGGKSLGENYSSYFKKGGTIGSVFTDTFKLFTGKYADGGKPPMGETALVGERGPELFIPDTRGTVVSNETIRATQGNAGMDTGAIAQAIQSLAERPSKLYIDGREFASVTYSSYEEAGSRSGRQPLVRSVG